MYGNLISFVKYNEINTLPYKKHIYKKNHMTFIKSEKKQKTPYHCSVVINNNSLYLLNKNYDKYVK